MSKCIVAVSGGPDSMALLDQLYKSGKDLAVAHVNYQHRDTAFRDEKIVKEYCFKRNIPVRVLYPEYVSGNFQAWARDVRYDFFEKVADEYQSKKIYVAHQMDDCIETYIFQKRRNMVCSWYGLKDESNRHGYCIIRPLLGYTKKELEAYCVTNQISYGIDESNLTNHYTRNEIRHSMIELMSKEEKIEYIQQIADENKELVKQNKKIELFLDSWDNDVEKLLQQENAWLYLDAFLFSYVHHHFSRKYLEELISQLHKNVLIDIEGYELERCQNRLYFVQKKESVHVILPKVEYKEYVDFSLDPSGNTIESCMVCDSDFPLTIRNVDLQDSIQMRFGKKSVHRFFIDRKIPRVYRGRWLVVQNSKGEVIFVPGLGCDVNHYSENANIYFKMHGFE